MVGCEAAQVEDTPMAIPHTTDEELLSGIAYNAARHIADAYAHYNAEFRAITRRAPLRFDNRDWKGSQRDSVERIDLYDRFGCPGGHVQAAFRCLTRFGGQIDPKVAETLSSRIHACWINPGAQPQTAAAQGPAPAAPATAGNAPPAPAASPSPAPSPAPAPPAK